MTMSTGLGFNVVNHIFYTVIIY